MKKTIAVLIALMLAVSCLSLTAFAQERNEMVPVVVKLPGDWYSPILWARVDDVTNALTA